MTFNLEKQNLEVKKQEFEQRTKFSEITERLLRIDGILLRQGQGETQGGQDSCKQDLEKINV